jgi:uncharacterized DUF497 family protein
LVWTWDLAKASANLRKHGVAFEDAIHALEDPKAVSDEDRHSSEMRWRTIGRSAFALLFVVHTWPDDDEYRPGRIVSVRKASRRERLAYETGDF